MPDFGGSGEKNARPYLWRFGPIESSDPRQRGFRAHVYEKNAGNPAVSDWKRWHRRTLAALASEPVLLWRGKLRFCLHLEVVDGKFSSRTQHADYNDCFASILRHID